MVTMQRSNELSKNYRRAQAIERLVGVPPGSGSHNGGPGNKIGLQRRGRLIAYFQREKLRACFDGNLRGNFQEALSSRHAFSSALSPKVFGA